MDEAETLCDRVAIMDHGQILQSGPPAALVRGLDSPTRISVASGLLDAAQAATSTANLIILPMAFFGGAFIPLDFAPAWIRDVSDALPLRYLVTGMQDVMARGEGPAAARPAIGILLGLAAVLSLVSVRVFRWDDV
jgi:ABC-2 type transport system permease protein